MTIYRGASFILTINVRDTDGNPVDLTGATARAEVRRRAAVSSALVLDLAPAITDQAGGIITINIPGATTAALEPGTGKWDLLVDMPGGDTLVLVPPSDITIEATATGAA